MKANELKHHFPCLADSSFHHRMIEVRERTHHGCFVCDPKAGHGLSVQFKACSDGTVEGECMLGPDYQSYSGIVHGGVLTVLLDGAMVNCLFAHGLIGVTGELNIRYKSPASPCLPLLVTAWIQSIRSPIFYLQSEITQYSTLVARASARFFQAGCNVEENE